MLLMLPLRRCVLLFFPGLFTLRPEHFSDVTFHFPINNAQQQRVCSLNFQQSLKLPFSTFKANRWEEAWELSSSGIQVPNAWRRWTFCRQRDHSSGITMESFAYHDWAKSSDAASFFLHPAWVRETLFRKRGDTRGLVVYMCDCLMIFLPFTSVFSFRVSCITAALTLFSFFNPSASHIQNCDVALFFLLFGTFHSFVKKLSSA